MNGTVGNRVTTYHFFFFEFRLCPLGVGRHALYVPTLEPSAPHVGRNPSKGRYGNDVAMRVQYRGGVAVNDEEGHL
jgi:hypothetical protein